MKNASYSHTHTITVRNYEIDWQGIVHNANYLLYFEVARLEYLKQLGMEFDQRSINGHSKIVVVRNEIDYLSPATFGDSLAIHTKIVSVKNSSITCESIMEQERNGTIVSKNKCILVWIDPTTNKSMRVPDHFRQRVLHRNDNSAAI